MFAAAPVQRRNSELTSQHGPSSACNRLRYAGRAGVDQGVGNMGLFPNQKTCKMGILLSLGVSLYDEIICCHLISG